VTENRFLLEPVGRNTAPAIALACLALGKEEIILVSPSDHLIKDETAYAKVLEELKKYSPEIYEASLMAYKNAKSGEQIRIAYEDMPVIPEDSVAYGVMEKRSKVKVIASDIDWSGLGSFDALDEKLPKDI